MSSEIVGKIGLTLVPLPAIVMTQLHDKPRVMVLTLLNRPTDDNPRVHYTDTANCIDVVSTTSS